MGVFESIWFLFKLLENATWQLQLTPLEIRAVAGCLFQLVTWPSALASGGKTFLPWAARLPRASTEVAEKTFSPESRCPNGRSCRVSARPARCTAAQTETGRAKKSWSQNGQIPSNERGRKKQRITKPLFLKMTVFGAEKSMKVFSKMAEP